MCLILSFMYKTLGEYSWGGLFKEPPDPNECPLTPPNDKNTIDPFSSSESIAQSAAEFHLALENLKSVCLFRCIYVD
jgi:hypothetical protein